MRRPLLLLAVALLASLVFVALRGSGAPFLPAAAGRTWWVHPEPLSAHGGAGGHRLTFRFTPARAGQLEIAAMRGYQLRSHAVVLAEHRSPGPSWKLPRLVQVSAEPLEVSAEDPRYLPALSLGGEAAPLSVEVERDGIRTAAIPAQALYAYPPALSGFAGGVPILLVLVIGAVLVTLAFRSRAPMSLAMPARPRLVAGIIAVHALLAAWNVARYPLARGLDAEGHVEYARLIALHGSVPRADAGWQTYHPPLYHAAGALALGLTGRERSMQILSALAGLVMVLLIARALGPARWRGTLVVAALPVLLLSEPQASNEIWFAALATASLVVAGREQPGLRSAVAAGVLAGLALLTKYTALVFLPGLVVAPLLARPRRRAIGFAAIMLGVALAIGVWPYLDRWRAFGDPVIGNWDDALGHPYRQPPGVRIAPYFLRFGAALVAHPFEARRWSLWDSLYVSTFGDGFGRFVSSPFQHYALFALAWLALPLMAVAVWGALAPGARSRLETAGLLAALLAIAALVRFNLELPYWSTAKGVFLLGLALPLALAFERGWSELASRAPQRLAALLDLDLAAFAVLSGATFLYR